MNTIELDEHISEVTASPVRSARLQYVYLGIAVLYVLISSYYIYNTRSRLASTAAAQRASIEQLQHRQDVTESDLKTSNELLAQQLGSTAQQLQTQFQQGMQSKTAELHRQQQALETRLTQQQDEQIGKVNGEVANVRTELGGARNDIAATRTDLDATKAKLERAIGDLTGQGTLIARTRDELEELKHRGDRNYYEFSLTKGARPSQVSTIALQLKKVNPKKNKFTLNVIADDRTIEKKDRGAAEPMQFYTARDHQLYEVVIFTVEKNVVTGYLSTPKSPGTPVSN
ncbi:MAG TPA: hypothetical protein VMT53_00940 [Terriglobales bacterium]|nr:hypothetical protein [Terriglobales bacterium]